MIRTTDIDQVLNVLADGGVIVFPTETSYGIGCDATNATAVARIFAIKGRPEGKGLPVLIPKKSDTSEYVQFSDVAEELADHHWPGGLNIVAPIPPKSPIAEACSQDDFQSVRVSSHPLAADLVLRFGKPIVATSANVSGEAAIYDPAEIVAAFQNRDLAPDIILDGGVLPFTPASTTVKVVGEGVEILRQGSVHI